VFVIKTLTVNYVAEKSIFVKNGKNMLDEIEKMRELQFDSN